MSDDPRLTTRAYRNLARWVLDRDRGACQIHGPRCTRIATEVDHIISRGDGGDVYDVRNLRAACRACNGWRSAQRTNAMRYRYRTSVPTFDRRL
jgi:5-methylcytosine-specific restriction protein A